MALVKCEECGKMISSRAEKCPQCGCPVTKKTKLICPECGCEVCESETKCSNCGCPSTMFDELSSVRNSIPDGLRSNSKETNVIDIEDLFFQARKAFSEKDFYTCRELYKRIETVKPTSWEAKFYKAYCNGYAQMERDSLYASIPTVFDLIHQSITDKSEIRHIVNEIHNAISKENGFVYSSYYAFGDALEKYWKEEYHDLIISTWQKGVKRQSIIHENNGSSEFDIKRINKYIDKLNANGFSIKHHTYKGEMYNVIKEQFANTNQGENYVPNYNQGFNKWGIITAIIILLPLGGYWFFSSEGSFNEIGGIHLTTPQNDGRICSELIHNAKTLKELDEASEKVYKYIDAYKEKMYNGEMSGPEVKSFLLEIGNVDAAINEQAAYITEISNNN